MNTILKRVLWQTRQHYRKLHTTSGTKSSAISGHPRDKINERYAPVTILSEDEQMIKDTARKFAEEYVKPLSQEMDMNSAMPRSLIDAIFDSGLFGVMMPVQYGGAGANLTAFVAAVEEICKADAGTGTYVIVHNSLINGYFQYLANEEQKERYFSRLCKSSLGAICISENGAGSDAFAMRCSATQKGDYYVLNGSKTWISNADHADIFLVMANVDLNKGYRGITCFIVERGMEGFTVGPKMDKLGLRSSGTCEIFLDDVKVHKSNILGEVGKSYKYMLEKLNDGRICAGAQGTGVSMACLQDVTDYLTVRKQFGKKLWDFQAIQHQVAEARTRLEAAQLLVYNATRRKEAGLPYTIESSMAKYYATETWAYIASKSVDWMGGVGFTKSYPLEKYYRDCKIGQIYEGTSNIQLNTIAKYWEMSGFPL